MRKILKQHFFNQPTLTVAWKLLGKYIVRKIGRREVALMITEVEAYDGPKDKASHTHRGKTARNTVMFGEPGRFYVYFTYGMHWMLNIVTGAKGYPSAILIRGTIYNSLTIVNNSQTVVNQEITGPARLTKFLKIDKSLNEKPAAKKTGLWFEDRGVTVDPKNVKRTPRGGVAYAGRVWSKKPYRFLLFGHRMSK